MIFCSGPWKENPSRYMVLIYLNKPTLNTIWKLSNLETNLNNALLGLITKLRFSSSRLSTKICLKLAWLINDWTLNYPLLGSLYLLNHLAIKMSIWCKDWFFVRVLEKKALADILFSFNWNEVEVHNFLLEVVSMWVQAFVANFGNNLWACSGKFVSD